LLHLSSRPATVVAALPPKSVLLRPTRGNFFGHRSCEHESAVAALDE
jgi:hypothetical protein